MLCLAQWISNHKNRATTLLHNNNQYRYTTTTAITLSSKLELHIDPLKRLDVAVKPGSKLDIWSCEPRDAVNPKSRISISIRWSGSMLQWSRAFPHSTMLQSIRNDRRCIDRGQFDDTAVAAMCSWHTLLPLPSHKIEIHIDPLKWIDVAVEPSLPPFI